MQWTAVRKACFEFWINQMGWMTLGSQLYLVEFRQCFLFQYDILSDFLLNQVAQSDLSSW